MGNKLQQTRRPSKLYHTRNVCNRSLKTRDFCAMLLKLTVSVTVSETALCVGCGRRRYGPSCELRCDCENAAPCDPVTGHCKCRLGWTGPRCNTVDSKYSLYACCTTEFSMGWVDPRVGLGWVGSGMGRKFLFLVGWIGSWVHKFTWQWVGLDLYVCGLGWVVVYENGTMDNSVLH